MENLKEKERTLNDILDPEYYDSENRLIKPLPRPVLVRIYNSEGQRRYIYRTDGGACAVSILSPELTFEQLDLMWTASPERAQFQQPQSVHCPCYNLPSVDSWHG